MKLGGVRRHGLMNDEQNVLLGPAILEGFDQPFPLGLDRVVGVIADFSLPPRIAVSRPIILQ